MLVDKALNTKTAGKWSYVHGTCCHRYQQTAYDCTRGCCKDLATSKLEYTSCFQGEDLSVSMRMLTAANVCLSLLSVPSLYDLESEGDEPYGSHSIEHPVRG